MLVDILLDIVVQTNVLIFSARFQKQANTVHRKLFIVQQT